MRLLRKILKYFAWSLALSFLYYLVFAMLVSSDTEKWLEAQIKSYAQNDAAMKERVDLLEDVVRGLELKDEQIYQAVFHTSAPRLPELSQTDVFAQISAEDVPEYRIYKYSNSQMDTLLRKAEKIEKCLAKVDSAARVSRSLLPPLRVPVDEFSPAMTGASTGRKVSPFYKVETSHEGMDILCPTGTAVRAVAHGVVKDVTKGRSQGNIVTLSHFGGYRTRYAFLTDIQVDKGDKVSAGDLLGKVGMTGKSYAPHLHYEVLRDSLVLNPVHFLFTGVSPVDYTNMLIISSNTRQSMD